MLKLFQVCLVILAIGLTIAQEQELCTEENSCYCKIQDGTIINLQPLGNSNGTMRFIDKTATVNKVNYSISYNPCYPATIQTVADIKNQECKNVAACLVNETENKNLQYQVAVHANVKYLKNSNTSWIHYYEISGMQEQDVWVELNCDEDAKDPTLKLIDVQQIWNQITYVRMKLTSICACPGGCPMEIPKKSSKGISFGSILLIFLSVAVLMYLLGGMIYNHRAKNATGCELLPNIEFWTAFPGLVMDGLRFTCNCCRTRRYGAAYDEA